VTHRHTTLRFKHTMLNYVIHHAAVFALSVVYKFSYSLFTGMWLSYVRVYAVTIPSVSYLSSVTLVRPIQLVKSFGNVYMPFCSLAIQWPPCKILRRSSEGNPSIGG